MHKKVIEETDKFIKQFIEEGLEQGDNLKYLGELVDIQKDMYEIECMKEEKEMYGEYGEYSARGGRGGNYGRDSYGREQYGEYGREYGARRRGSRGRYRGDDYLDRMSEEYGRYQENRERYGAGEESDKAFHFMSKALGEYIEFLYEEAETPQQKQMLMQTIQSSMR